MLTDQTAQVPESKFYNVNYIDIYYVNGFPNSNSICHAQRGLSPL